MNILEKCKKAEFIEYLDQKYRVVGFQEQSGILIFEDEQSGEEYQEHYLDLEDYKFYGLMELS
jgi:hypothetical protein